MREGKRGQESKRKHDKRPEIRNDKGMWED